MMVASKFDEIDYNVMKANAVAVQIGFRDSCALAKAEIKLLEFFDWDIKFATPLHFLYTYFTCGVALEGEQRDQLISLAIKLSSKLICSSHYL